MKKPQTLSRRAATFARTNKLFDYSKSALVYDAQCWAAGYRAAMRDVRKLIDPNASDKEIAAAIDQFVNDTVRLR